MRRTIVAAVVPLLAGVLLSSFSGLALAQCSPTSETGLVGAWRSAIGNVRFNADGTLVISGEAFCYTAEGGRLIRQPDLLPLKSGGATRWVAKEVSDRHLFTTPLLEDGYHTRTVRDLLRHRDLRKTMIYTHVQNDSPGAIRSPANRLLAQGACIEPAQGPLARRNRLQAAAI